MTVVDEDELDTGEWEEFPAATRSRRRLVFGILGGLALIVLISGFLGYRYIDSKVSPSGVALATALAAIIALAPGRFSTITIWPNACFICSPNRRATRSMPPPAG